MGLVMVCFKNVIVSFIIVVSLAGCGSSMKEFGGNMMTTTGGGSPVGALVGVSLGGLLYGIGSSMEETDIDQKFKDAENGKLPEVTYYAQKILPDEDLNTTIIATTDINSTKE